MVKPKFLGMYVGCSKHEVRLLEVDIHGCCVGMMFAPITEDGSYIDFENMHRLGTQTIMKSLGFLNKKEYLEAYPGHYAFDSSIVPAMKLDTFVSDPKWQSENPEYGIMESLRVYSHDLFDGTFDYVVERIVVNVEASIKANSTLGSITVYPTTKDFMKYAKVKNRKKRMKDLWFCEDWKE